MKETRIHRELKYSCTFLELYEDKVKLHDGRISQRVVIKHPGGACVLPITPEGHVILTKQYRYPIERMSIEIPAGKKDVVGEDGLMCAMRELEEETGYGSKIWEKLYAVDPCVGYSDERLDLFVARACYKIEHPKDMDEDETIDVMIVDKYQIQNMLKDGSITDGKTIIALQHYLLVEV
jgi:ADP-ribose pyrophosphatase